jgi:hypothetical protein
MAAADAISTSRLSFFQRSQTCRLFGSLFKLSDGFQRLNGTGRYPNRTPIKMPRNTTKQDIEKYKSLDVGVLMSLVPVAGERSGIRTRDL